MPAGVTVMPAGVTGVNRRNDYAARHEPAYRYATRHIDYATRHIDYATTLSHYLSHINSVARSSSPRSITVSAANTFIVEHFLRGALISSTTAQRQWHSIKSSMLARSLQQGGLSSRIMGGLLPKGRNAASSKHSLEQAQRCVLNCGSDLIPLSISVDMLGQSIFFGH